MNAPARIDTTTARPIDERLFTANDFARMMECGAFEDMRVELVEGTLERMAPAYGDHGSQNLSLGAQLLHVYRNSSVWLATDLAIRISDVEVRGADIAVVRDTASKEDLVEGRDLILVVEIAKTTLGRDLGDKPLSYARAGIPECWVVDLGGRVVHCFTGPCADGYANRTMTLFGTPLMPPGASEAVTVG